MTRFPTPPLPNKSSDTFDAIAGTSFYDNNIHTTEVFPLLPMKPVSEDAFDLSSIEPTPLGPYHVATEDTCPGDEVLDALSDQLRDSCDHFLAKITVNNFCAVSCISSPRENLSLTEDHTIFFKVDGPQSSGRKQQETVVSNKSGLFPEAYLQSDASDSRTESKIQKRNSDIWDDRYEELRQFHSQHGHCNVPHKEANYSRLAEWIRRQRHQWNLKQQGRHSTLTKHRQDALDAIVGFTWNPHGVGWKSRYDELRAFKALHGHCNVPTMYPENRELSVWVKYQRRQYKLLLLGKKTNISPSRISQLNCLGFRFNPRNLAIPEDCKQILPF